MGSKRTVVLIIFVLAASFASYVVTVTLVHAWNGPPSGCVPPGCNGAVSANGSGNVSVGTTTPAAAVKFLVVASSTDTSNYGLEVIQPSGTAILVVRNDGSIGIGTTSPAYTLDVNGTIRGTTLLGGLSGTMTANNVTNGVFGSCGGCGSGNYSFPASLGVGTSTNASLPQTLSVYGGGSFSGNVGIGTTNPFGPLHVVGNSAGNTIPQVMIGDSGSTSAAKELWLGYNTTNDNAYIQAIHQNSAWTLLELQPNGGNVGIGTTNAGTLLAIGSALVSPGAAFNGKLDVRGGSLGTTAGNTVKIADFSFDASSTNHVGLGLSAVRVSNGADWTSSALKFQFDVDNTNPVNDNMIVFNSNGNVGIGTAAPGAQLDVQNPIGVSSIAIRATNASGTMMLIPNSGAGAYNNLVQAGDQTLIFYGTGSNTGNLVIGPWSSTGSPGIRMTVAGNVGIGTTAPANSLDVSGGINAGGTISFNSGNRLAMGVIGSIPSNDNGDYVGWLNSGLGHNAGTLALMARSSIATDISFYTSSTERMTILNNGNVSIPGALTVGSCTGCGAGLSGGQANYVPLWTSAAAQGTSTIYQSGGNVGIATTSPAYALDVNGTIRGTTLLGGLSGTVTANNVTNGVFGSCGGCGSGNYSFPASLGAGTSTNASLPATLSVYGGGYFTGNVGIGTTGPASKLAIDSSGGTANYITLQDSGVAKGYFGNSNGSNNIFTGDVAGDVGIRSQSNLLLGSGGDHVRIYVASSSGNVGIGTTSPGAELDVEGGGNILLGSAGTSTLILSGGTGLATTKQNATAYGPEMITAIAPSRRVLLWSGYTGDTNAQFLINNNGFLEWGAGGGLDQDTSFYRSGTGLMDFITYKGLDMALGPLAGNTEKFIVDMATTTSNELVLVNKPFGSGHATLDVAAVSSSITTIRAEEIAATNGAFDALVNGDAQPRFVISASGGLSWGSGPAVGDVNLFRNATGSLIEQTITNSYDGFTVLNSAGGRVLDVDTTDGRISINSGTVTPPSATLDVTGVSGVTAIRASQVTATDLIFGLFVAGDAQLRYVVNGAGTIQWGPGSATGDVQLTRNGSVSLAVSGVSASSTNTFVVQTPAGLVALDVDTANQRVGVGTSTPATALQVIGDVRVGNSGTNGCVQGFGGASLVGTCSSDIRLKKNLTPFTGALDKLTELQPYYFYWRSDAYPKLHLGNERNLGFIAQDVEKVIPELVATTTDGFKGITYGAEFDVWIVEALKELNAASVKVKDGIAYVSQLIADKITAKTVVTESIQMNDTATGAVYCVRVTNGEFVKTKGSCN